MIRRTAGNDAPQQDQQGIRTGEQVRTAEDLRLLADRDRAENWKRWGPYLAERQWGTVREDYSATGECWSYLPHDHARSRAYRWGEDGLLGFCDRECRLCFAVTLWNGHDPILKERLFGLGGPEGNHGEDVKECYYYLDSSPTHSYFKALYKYPQNEFPYRWLVEENARRDRNQPEFELIDTGIFNDNRYFDVFVEYAKASPDDILIRLTVVNRGPETATLQLLPTLWFRNSWSWGCEHDGCDPKPHMQQRGPGEVGCEHVTLGKFRFFAGADPAGNTPDFLFTQNETNYQRIFQTANSSPQVKDSFHDYVIHGQTSAVEAGRYGTKCAAQYRLEIPAGGEQTVQLRLVPEREVPAAPFGPEFSKTFAQRIRETDDFYEAALPAAQTPAERLIARQAYAGLLWSKQFYHYVIKDWLQGDPHQPAPPAGHRFARNTEWLHLFNRDVVSMPDKWEYPWYAAWDLAFHMLPFAEIDGEFAKQQLLLFLREWYMHPNGQLPAYEFAFGDVNPPVHAWACWRVFKITGDKGRRDYNFLKRAFQKLLINFTWWVNRKDPQGRNLFSGGFLGLDNIGVFDRSKPLPNGGSLEQADATAWMAFFCSTMLSMALEIASVDDTYEDIASKFFEHFVAIVDAMNSLGGTGLWNDEDGQYYDMLNVNDTTIPLRIRSMVGIIPLFAVEILDQRIIDKLPGFKKRMDWFLQHRSDLARHISYCDLDGNAPDHPAYARRLLAIPSRERLERMLRYLLDENEFLSQYGIRALSKVHEQQPYVLKMGGEEQCVQYVPGESNTPLFGGNSNWRGPIWFPVNYLLIEALERYHHFYGDTLKVECPVGSGTWLNLQEVAREISRRLKSLFLPDEQGRRPCHGEDQRYANDPHWRDLVLFYEYFHGDNGRGCGASHQTGWTSLVARLLRDCEASSAR
ncbi:MGH1-like glycoside hydrolase domain-containing protein [Planctomicrobium sp. SH664]|uniref:MGH1-like glycoside hydrolase domain-containing protein n=1 Tax=Planctomicrobium sp. SH664 TaxID=3448125 RepID=UPI003F5C4BFE